MQAFHIGYRNTQGTLMRILNAASRRALDLYSVRAEAAECDYQVTLMLEVNPKQVGQLYREWYAIADVVEVRSSSGLHEHAEHSPASAHGAAWTAPHPPASAATGHDEAHAALA
jgi:acetolactate synthase small subunit